MKAGKLQYDLYRLKTHQNILPFFFINIYKKYLFVVHNNYVCFFWTGSAKTKSVNTSAKDTDDPSDSSPPYTDSPSKKNEPVTR